MEPITLRLPQDLLDQLDNEADSAAFSSRSEYIRHLLHNRDQIALETTTDIEPHTDARNAVLTDEDSCSIADVVSELDRRLEAVERQLGHEATDKHQETADTGSTTTAFEVLEDWLTEHGPQSDDAQAIVLAAAKHLDEHGPLSAGQLKKTLHTEFPDAYSSADALWASTIERLYGEIPGFTKPEYGTYNFNRDLVSAESEK